jgi:hypothetical protein
LEEVSLVSLCIVLLNVEIAFLHEGNGVESKQYNLEVRAVPTIKEFEMQLDFPSFLGRKREIVKGTGNTIVPEGTVVTWLH